ncbi:hypothetical protein FDECE_13484 [Fusarium decemcellulare]|nr:hypothetical protein FDECE_13484 [Fusarium decemcellulare]
MTKAKCEKERRSRRKGPYSLTQNDNESLDFSQQTDLSISRETKKHPNSEVANPSRPSALGDGLEGHQTREDLSAETSNVDAGELDYDFFVDEKEPARRALDLSSQQLTGDSDYVIKLQLLARNPDSLTKAQLIDLIRVLELKLAKETACVFKLRSQISEKQNAKNELLNNIHTTDKTEYNHRAQTSHLLRQLEAKDKLWQDTEEFKEGAGMFSAENIEKKYNFLYDDLNEVSTYICEMSPSGDDVPQQKSQNQQSAQTWALKASGLELKRLLSYCHEEELLKQKLFASLVMAGVFELIFEPIFPEFLAFESPLLTHYSDNILMRFGKQIQNELDAMAIKSLTSDNSFKEVVRETAKSFAEFMMSVLQLFLPSESKHTDLCRNIFIKGAGSLESFLAKALFLKCQFALCKVRFRFYFFKPGDPFDAKTMRQDVSCTVGLGGDRRHKPDRVKLCLFPALYSLPENEGELKEPPKAPKKYLDNLDDKCLTEASRDELKLLSLVAKAVVLT